MHIRVGESIKLKGKYSTFIKTTEPEAIKLINSFGRVYYHEEEGMWELPKEAFRIFLCNYPGELIIHDLDEKSELIYSRIEGQFGYATNYMPKTKPYEHQRFLLEYSKSHNKFLLADEQGLGKTKQAIDVACSKQDKFKHCLIVCGVNGLKYNWLNEIKVHSDREGYILGTRGDKIGSVQDRLDDLNNIAERNEFFLITNVETLRNKEVQKKIKALCEDNTIGMTIIDEIHKCKNSQSEQGKAIHCCCSYYKIALTGTPLMNECIDLYNILKWLEVENHNLTQWKNYYCEMGGFGGYQIVGYRHLEELQEMLDSVMVRRRKVDVLDLPPKIYINELLEMNNNQAAIYEEVKEALIKDIDRIRLSHNPLAELIRLRQATASTAILSSKVNASCKIDRLLEIMEEVNGKAVIFSNWTSVTDIVTEKLKKYKPAVITGETKDVQAELNKFKKNKTCKCIIGTIGALGTGYTLTEADTVIFLDEPWTMADKLQAEDRCHRIGTKDSVTVITLMCKDTIDERIHEIIERKGVVSDTLVDNVYDVEDLEYLLN